MRRKKPLVTDEIYHVFTRSIADYVIFNDKNEFERMRELLKYYQIDNGIKFSEFIELKSVVEIGFNNFLDIIFKDKEKSVQIIAYSLMPTHIHLVLKQLMENGISNYMQKVLNSYSTYFNITHKRKGPLWESRFKSVLVEKDEEINNFFLYFSLYYN